MTHKPAVVVLGSMVPKCWMCYRLFLLLMDNLLHCLKYGILTLEVLYIPYDGTCRISSISTHHCWPGALSEVDFRVLVTVLGLL